MIRYLILIIGMSVTDISMSEGGKEYKEYFSGEDLARRFYGNKSRPELIKAALNVGRVSVNLKTGISCGKLDIAGSIEGTVKDIEDGLKGLIAVVGSINPMQLALMATCTDQPELCTYLRDLNARFTEKLNFQMNSCELMDKHFHSQADKGRAQMEGKRIEKCLGGGSYNIKKFEECKRKAKADPRTRNLLQPFVESYIDTKQNVLSSILKVSKESDHYDSLAMILGEVEMEDNGYWVKTFPKGRLRPDQFANNYIAKGESISCDLPQIKTIIATNTPSNKKGIEKYIENTIKEKITPEILFDLESVPEKYKEISCQKIGQSIAAEALKKYESDSSNALKVSLANNALPEDLREFFKEESEATYSAISKRIAAKDIKPFSENIRTLALYANNFRRKGRESQVITINNKRKYERYKEKNKCVDTLSCDYSRQNPNK